MALGMDDQFDSAIATGIQNREIMQLCHDHCQHMEFFEAGGRGMLEAQTGLPINMRRVRCPKAIGSMGGMDLGFVAGSFYEEHCIGCDLRKPTGRLPTFATVMEAQAHANAEAEARAAAEADAIRAEWVQRSKARLAGNASSNPSRVSIMSALDILDPDPSTSPSRDEEEAARARLVALAERAPDAFDESVVGVLLNLVATQKLYKLLEPLRIVAVSRPSLRETLVALSLVVLGRGRSVEAAQVLVQFPDLSSEAHFSDSVTRSMLKVAFAPSYESVGHLVPSRSTNAPALHLLAGRAPARLQIVLESMLPGPKVGASLILPPGSGASKPERQLAEFDRATAGAAIAELLRSHPKLAEKMLPALVRNVLVAGDMYDRYPSSQVSGTLGLAIALKVGDVPALLDATGAWCSNEQREALFNIWRELDRIVADKGRWFNSKDLKVSVETAIALKDQMLQVAMSMTAGRWGAEVAADAGQLIEDLAKEDAKWAFEHRDAFLGGVLAALNAMSVKKISPLITKDSTAPSVLTGLEDMSRVQAFGVVVRCLLTAVEQAAAEDPVVVLASLRALIDDYRNNDADKSRDNLAWYIVPLFGRIGASHGARPGVLRTIVPQLHTYLVSEDVSTTARAIEAWSEIHAKHPLPSTLEDLLPALLADAHLVVIKAMLKAAVSMNWTEDGRRRLFVYSLRLCASLPATGDEGELLLPAIRATFRLAKKLGDTLKTSEGIALVRAGDLDGYDLRDVLRFPWSEELAQSRQMAALRLRQFEDPSINDRFNNHDDREAVDLLKVGPGLVDLELSQLSAAAASFELEAAWSSLEVVEVAWRAGRSADALELVNGLTARLPDHEAIDLQRKAFALVASAIRHELNLPGDPPEAPPTHQVKYLADLYNQTVVRRQIRETLQGVSSDGAADIPDRIDMRSSALARLGKTLASASQRRTPTSAYLRAIASLAIAGGHLLKMDAAEHRGDADSADTARRAARRTAQSLSKELLAQLPENDPIGKLVLEASKAVQALEDGSGVDALLESWTGLPVPLQIIAGSPFERRSDRRANASTPAEVPDVGVVFVSVNNQQITGPMVLKPNTVYSLGTEVLPGEWPLWASSLELEFISQFDDDAISMPRYSWTKRDLDDSTRLKGTATILLNFRLPSGQSAPPFLVALWWTGSINGEPVRRRLNVAGHAQIRIRPFDSSRDALTAYPVFDERLLELYGRLPDAGFDDEDIQSFCRLFTAICRIGLRMTWDKDYKRGQKVRESKFQADLFKGLMADPALQGRVVQGTPLGLGFLDIRHDRITAELKVERYVAVSKETAPKYMGQATQYAAADGSRLAILAILDMSAKELPVGTPENYIFELYPEQHGMRNPEAPSLVATIVVNGNMPSPSSWSRKRRPKVS